MPPKYGRGVKIPHQNEENKKPAWQSWILRALKLLFSIFNKKREQEEEEKVS